MNRAGVLAPYDADWSRAQKGNDWGSLTYAINDRRVSTKHMRGKNVHVRWPDGPVTLERVDVLPYFETVHDHGHSYGVSSNELGIRVDVRGAKVFVPIEVVEIDPKEWRYR